MRSAVAPLVLDDTSAKDLNHRRLKLSTFGRPSTSTFHNHDLPKHLNENRNFVEQIAKHGVTDLSVGFYMALPGTELFHSLYDSNKIKLDIEYFKHILDSLALFPSQKYCSAISRMSLLLWKLKFYLRFYKSKKSINGKFGLLSLFLFVIDLILMRNGQDWTARILGLRVVRSNGDIAGLAHMWTRLSVSVFSYLPFGLGFFWAYYDRYNQTLHDKLMGTYVVLDEPQLAERQRSSGSKAMFWSYFCVGFVVLMVLLIILSTVFL